MAVSLLILPKQHLASFELLRLQAGCPKLEIFPTVGSQDISKFRITVTYSWLLSMQRRTYCHPRPCQLLHPLHGGFYALLPHIFLQSEIKFFHHPLLSFSPHLYIIMEILQRSHISLLVGWLWTLNTRIILFLLVQLSLDMPHRATIGLENLHIVCVTN